MSRSSTSPDLAIRLGWVAQWATPQRLHWWADLAGRVDLRVYLLDEAPSELSPGVPVVISGLPEAQRVRTSRLHNRWTWAPQYWWHGAPRAIRSDALDAIVVNGWTQPAFIQVLAVSARDRLPAIVYFEPSGRHPGAIARRLRAKTLRLADGVIAAGPQAAREARKAGIASTRIAQVSPPAALPMPGRSPALGVFDTEGEAKGHQFLYVGRLVQGKNIDLLIQAFSRMRRGGDRLAIVGSGPQLPVIRDEIERHGLGSHVRLAGALAHEHVAEYMRACHTLVLPSERESWGLVVSEGLLAGMHAVVSRAAAVSEVVSCDEGVYVAPPEVGAFAAAMARSRDDWGGRIEHPKQRDRGVEAASREILSLLHRIGGDSLEAAMDTGSNGAAPGFG